MLPNVSGAGVEQRPVTAKLHVGGLLYGIRHPKAGSWSGSWAGDRVTVLERKDEAQLGLCTGGAGGSELADLRQFTIIIPTIRTRGSWTRRSKWPALMLQFPLPATEPLPSRRRGGWAYRDNRWW